MSEAIPVYAAPAEGCRVCGGLHMYPLDDAVGCRRCIAYLLGEIGTLQGEVLVLRLALAARPEPAQRRIPTYAELLERLRVFAPEPLTNLLPDAGSIGRSPRLCEARHPGWGLCTRRKSHRPPHGNHISGGRWEDPPPHEPQTEAGAAIADAATWPEPLGPATPRVVAPGEA